MAADYRVTSRSDAEVRELAKRARYYFRVVNQSCVDIRGCVSHPLVWTVRGEEALTYDVRPDFEMGVDDAATSYGKAAVKITAKTSVDAKALVGVGRDRQTLAHELGHAVMHHGPTMSRRTGATGAIKSKHIKPFESAEHQAKVFAAAFLINDGVAKRLSSPEEISVEFGISLESARIYYEEMTEPIRRKESFERVDNLVASLRAAAVTKQTHPIYMAEGCTNCGNATLIPVGIKFLCDTCGNVSDRFQDGDTVSG
jgi:hypothetical protein